MRKLRQHLHVLDPRVNFKKKDVQGAFRRIYASHSEWPQTEEARREYQHHVSQRVLHAIQHFQTTHVNKKPAQWAIELLGTATKKEVATDGDQEPYGLQPTSRSDDEQEPPTSQDKYYYGWPLKHEQAWRAPVDDPERNEFTDNIEAGRAALKPVVAILKDGERRPITALITATWKAISEADASNNNTKRDSAIYWKGESGDGSSFVVKRRLDGNDSAGQSKKLTSLYIGSKQRCSIPQTDSIPEQVGIDVLTTIAKNIIDGTL